MTGTRAILQLLRTRGLGTRTLGRILDRAAQDGYEPDEVVRMPPERLSRVFGLSDDVARNVAEARGKAEALDESLTKKDIRVLFRGAPGYPDRLVRILGEQSPPVLFVHGNVGLLSKSGVSFAGSRKASDRGLAITAQCARVLTEHGVNIVSGYAAGVDLAAHMAAMEASGTTTIVLAEGILNFRRKMEISSLLSEGNFVVVSEFVPDARWMAGQAMQRNRTIIGLSDALIVVEAGQTGGTFAGGEAALDLNFPLFVVEYATPPDSAAGNSLLLARGAHSLKSNAGKPNLRPVLDALNRPDREEALPKVKDQLFQTTTEDVASNGDEGAPPLKIADVQVNEQIAKIYEERPVKNVVRSNSYPKRLIEVDLPIKRISAHARREKSIRHGHISTLHIWWARRPLAACRAVICASLWPDPADPNCPQSFRDVAAKQIKAFAKASQSNKWGAEICDNGSFSRYMRLTHGGDIDPTNLKGQIKLRAFLFDFIADFAAWEATTNHWFLDTARAITQAAHEALGGEKGTRPLVVDPFAGGGAIPLEALRVGADAFASDLNPVAVLLNKVVLEYIPKYGQKLADEVQKWGQWVKAEAEKELAQFYPKDADGSTPIAYLWARTIQCEGPSCGAEVPLMRSLWLAKKGNRSIAVKVVPNAKQKRVDFEIIHDVKAKDVGEGTVRRGSATCPCCGYTTPVASVRLQLKSRKGGAHDARLYAVVTTRSSEQGRFFRLPTEADFRAVRTAAAELEKRRAAWTGTPSLFPDEPLPLMSGVFNAPIYGHDTWGRLFTPRQLIALTTLVRLIRDTADKIAAVQTPDFAAAVKTCLGLNFGRLADLSNSFCGWKLDVQCPTHLFARQAIGMVWDFSESVCLSQSSGSWSVMTSRFVEVLSSLGSDWSVGSIQQASATHHPLPDDTAMAVVTDPPYYNAVPYADLSDFFYVWLRRLLTDNSAANMSASLTPKEDEICEMAGWDPVRYPHKDGAWFEKQMGCAMAEARRILTPSGIGVIVFAHKSTDGWEAMLKSIVDAGWVVTGSWPIDTEMGTRLRAQGSAALASSVHLVCRPRESADGAVRENEVGDWRDVLAELPKRTREWMKRLGEEGVVGADAIFACLGPALEIFSRYSRVEKASGEAVLLKEYLTYVWGAVAQEALAQIFKDADARGFEEDARLTAMWLWTLNAGTSDLAQKLDAAATGDTDAVEEVSEEEDDEDVNAGSNAKGGGYVLEYDAARKIAQGLGAHLDQLTGVIEVKGDKARLLGVAERTRRLFGKDEAEAPKSKAKKKDKQFKLFSLEEVETEEGGWGDKSVPKLGDTVLDRIHQSMILFAAGRGEALRRFLVDDGAGHDQRFWKLAQALSALYPQGTDEKRWVDGVLARKKGLGL